MWVPGSPSSNTGAKRSQAIVRSEILNWNEPPVSTRRGAWLRQFKNKVQPKHLWNREMGYPWEHCVSIQLKHVLNVLLDLISPGTKLSVWRRQMNSGNYYDHVFSLCRLGTFSNCEILPGWWERLRPALSQQGWLWNPLLLSLVTLCHLDTHLPKCCAGLPIYKYTCIDFFLKSCCLLILGGNVWLNLSDPQEL